MNAVGPEKVEQPLPRSAHRSPWVRVLDALNSLGSGGIFALMLLVCADVAGRSLFGRPISGVAETAAYGIVGIVFLQIAAAAHHGRMTRADFLSDRLIERSPRAGHSLQALNMLVGLALFAVLAKASWAPLVSAIGRGEFYGVEGLYKVPTWPLRLVIFGGAAITAVVYATRAWGRIRAALEASHREGGTE